MPDCIHVFTTLGQLKIYQRIVRSSLSMAEPERRVLLFILDRSIGWNKASEIIATQEFVEGVFRRKKGHRRTIVRGTGLTTQQLREALDNLHEIGAITWADEPRGTRYWIDEDWCHSELRVVGGKFMWEVHENDYRYLPVRGEDD